MVCKVILKINRKQKVMLSSRTEPLSKKLTKVLRIFVNDSKIKIIDKFYV